MPQGLEIYGDHGLIQVGIDAPNMVVLATGKYTLLANGTAGAPQFQFAASVGRITYVGHAASNPLIAFMAPGSGMAFIMRSTPSAGSTTWTFDFGGNSTAGTLMPYWIFDVPSQPLTSSSGFATWDSTGNLIFSTDFAPMRLVDLINISDMGGFGVAFSGNKTYTAGRQYATVYCRYTGATKWQLSGGIGTYAMSGYSMTAGAISGGIAFRSWQHSKGQTTTNPDYSQETTCNGTIMVVDVTGLPNST